MMFGLGIQEVLIVGTVAVLLFGKRLPEVARSLGNSYSDFRRGLTEMQSQMDFRDTYYSSRSPSTYLPNAATDEPDEYDQPSAPRFELPPPAESSSEGADNSLN